MWEYLHEQTSLDAKGLTSKPPSLSNLMDPTYTRISIPQTRDGLAECLLMQIVQPVLPQFCLTNS